MHFAGKTPAGNFVAPHIFELTDQLTEEVFGPCCMVRYPQMAGVLRSIERDYGLTLGIHSRIDGTIERGRPRSRHPLSTA